jgi:hypothetical protein
LRAFLCGFYTGSDQPYCNPAKLLLYDRGI